MKTLKLGLQHCYGIKRLNAQFDFSSGSTYAIYAPNGAMKSSLAETFKDVQHGETSRDRVFPDRKTIRTITTENGDELDPHEVLVLPPYDEVFGDSRKTSTLLVDRALRHEYEQIHGDTEKAKDEFLSAMRKQAGFRKDIEAEVSLAFTASPDELYRALLRIRDEVRAQTSAPLADVPYTTLFDDKVVAFLETRDFKTAIQDYIRRYNELLDASSFFRRGVFTYYNASEVAKALAKNGFFAAKHTLTLNAEEQLELSAEDELEDLVAKEKEAIATDPELRKKYNELESLLTRNANLRDFQSYISEHEDLLPRFENIGKLKEDVWKSYIKTHEGLFENVIQQYEAAQKRREEIKQAANEQRTQWETVIDIFNSRFFVPFRLEARNRVSVILGEEPVLELGFVFVDDGEEAKLDRSELMAVLSTGEKKALYILNVLFEVEVRRQQGQRTVVVVDDIADSFDYKNKYAIIHYLKDMAEQEIFSLILLTHNFDFFRTVNSRFVPYSHCLMAERNSDGIILQQATGIRNVFVNDWKQHFFSSPRKRIASIPFIRNLVEYTQGAGNSKYERLTSLLHWKKDSQQIAQGDLDTIYGSVFQEAGEWPNPDETVVDAIALEAKACLDDPGGVNFENKIVLAIGIRLAAERFMVDRIADRAFLDSITSNQTPKLLERLKTEGRLSDESLDVLERVVLMTPEDIHLNSFMYEPILDMADDHLKALYGDILNLRMD